MNDFLSLVASTLALRPYVFLFFITYLILAITSIGLLRTTLFTILAYLIAFLSEYSSTHNGFPYGFYTYIENTMDKELWVLNIPFFDSLSYCFLAYFSYSFAIFLLSEIRIKKGDVMIINHYNKRESLGLILASAILFMLVDIIVDPTTLRGSKWFLGQIYYYHNHGIYFGVPISNFVGWFIVGFAIIASLQLLDNYLCNKGINDIWIIAFPYKSIFGPLVYLSVMLFIIIVTFFIQEYPLGLTSSIIFIGILSVFIRKLYKSYYRATNI